MSSNSSENTGTLGQVVQVAETRAGAAARAEAPPLPDNPLVTIRPGRAWAGAGLRELWEFRELLYFLVWRDVKIRYKQTALGASWAVLQPLLTTLIFTLFFGVLARMDSGGLPYPLFAFAGVLPWTFFSNAVTQSSNSIVGNAHLITKVYFPRMIIPAASVGAGVLDFAIAFVVLILMMLYYGVAVTWGVLMLPVLVLQTVLLAVGVGMWLSALNVKYRDVRFVVPFLIQVWMFLSPVIYPATLVPPRWRWLLMLNPMTGIIEGFRAALFGAVGFDWAAILVSASVTLALLAYAVHSFTRTERGFADTI